MGKFEEFCKWLDEQEFTTLARHIEERNEEDMAKVNWNDKAKTTLLSYAKSISKNCPTLAQNGRNLTEMYYQGKLDPCYHRDGIIINMQKILLRKSKANVLLTGPAGCGKTAIAEGLTALLAERDVRHEAIVQQMKAEYDKAYRKWDKARDDAWENHELFTEEEPTKPTYPNEPMMFNTIVFDLSLTAMTAGTKYRGEFEEKIQNVINECRQYPNIVLFIDEIHQIVSAGASDNSDNAAQMLKPALARRDIRCIGATTTEEARYIWSDKALARRFNEVKIVPLANAQAEETAENILKDYCKYHGISAPAECVHEIIEKLQIFLPQTVFPDNFINVIDETLAGARFDGLTAVDMSHFNATLSRMAGVVIV